MKSVWHHLGWLFALSMAIVSHVAVAQTLRPEVAQVRTAHPPLSAAQQLAAQQTWSTARTQANRVALAAHDSALAYVARFQAKQVENHIRNLTLALQHPSCASAGCKAALQNRITVAEGERATLLRTLQPRNLFGFNGTLVPPRILTVPTAPRGQPPPPPPPSCTPPQITSAYAPGGQPGTSVSITGSGFGSSQGTSAITLIVSPTQTLSATTVDYWSDTQIITSVPSASGLMAYAGNLFVTTCQQSNAVSFQFNPTIDIEALAFNGYGTFTLTPLSCWGDYCPDNQILYGSVPEHLVQAGFYQGGNGDDTYFQGPQLQNGWTVSAAQLYNIYTVSSGDYCSLKTNPVGSTWPYTVVHWNVSPTYGDAGYSLQVFVTGPLGVPYQ